MTKLEEFQSCGEALEKILLLRTSPLAVKMLKSEAEIPAESIRPKRDRGHHLAQCQAFALSRRQNMTVAMLKEDNWCWGPLIAYGLIRPEIAEDYPELKYQAGILPRFEYGKYIGIVSAPLRTASFIPDVVLIYANPAQLRSMLLAMKFSKEPLVKSVFDPIDSCAYAVVPPILEDEFRITLPDPGEYERALAAEDEIILSVPGNKIKNLVDYIRKADERKSIYKDTFLEMVPDFHQPEFYKKLFKQCGLDGPQ